MLKVITQEDIIHLRELLYLPINKYTYAGTDKDNYFFHDLTHVLFVDGGAITANISTNTINNIGCLSDNTNSHTLLKNFITVINYYKPLYDTIIFGSFKSNDRLSRLMSKKHNCKIIKETDEVIYFKYTKEEANDDV